MSKGKITVEKDYSQLERADQIEVYREGTKLDSLCEKIHGSATSLKGAMVYGREGQDHLTAKDELLTMHKLSGRALQMMGVKLACVAAMLLTLAGCNCECEREDVCERKCAVKAEARPTAKTALVGVPTSGTPSQGVNGCKTGQCPIQGK